MAAENGTPEEKPERISVSLSTLRREIENAVLKLQVSLADTFAAKADVHRLENDLRVVAEAAQKHIEVLDAKIATLEKINLAAIDEKVEALQQDKAGRDAVTSFKKWLTGGAVLGSIFMAIQVAISLWLVTRGASG